MIYARSKVRYAQIADGLSNTYLIGEKNVEGAAYRTGSDAGDNEHLYAGFGRDCYRTAHEPPRPDLASLAPSSFGSAHPSTVNMAFADGSVHRVSYDVDLQVHRRLGGRDDGQAVDFTGVD